MQPWWWRSVAACSSVAVAAGLVAAVVGATDADRVQRVETSRAAAAADTVPAAAPASPVAESSPAPRASAPAPRRDAGPPRAVDRVTGASVAVPQGWRVVGDQRLVPVPPDRFDTVLAAGGRAVVLVGPLDPARVRIPAVGPALEDEARRLVAAFGDGAAPTATRLAALRDDDVAVAGRAAFTSLRRADGGDRRTAGTLVRVSTVDAAPGARTGVVLLAVVLPGPTQAADARAAEAVVRSLAPVRPGRAATPPPRRPAAEPQAPPERSQPPPTGR